MEEIFRHTDQDGDQLSVYECPREGRGGLRVDVTTGGDRSYVVDLGHQTVTDLRDKLTQWLGETIETLSTPPAPDTELIERLVSQAVTKVLPLHLAPIAQAIDTVADAAAQATKRWQRLTEATGAPWRMHPVLDPGCTHNGLCRDANGVRCIPCPEPQDAPHPVHPVRCRLCGAEWSDGHGQPGDPCLRRSHLAVLCGCGHRRQVHGDECTVDECTCKLTWTQVQAYLSASAPVPECLCDHAAADHYPLLTGGYGHCEEAYCECDGYAS